MKPVIPHEHGAWAFLIVPFLIGSFLGTISFLHLFLLIAWLCFYMGTYCLKEWLKRGSRSSRYMNWMMIYGVIGLVSIIWPVLHQPKLMWFAPAFMISMVLHIWFTQRKKERSMWNDLNATLSFSLGAIAGYLLGNGVIDSTILIVYVHCVFYFMGTVFFVKSVIRERKNPAWMMYAKIYHLLLLLLPIVIKVPWLVLAYLFPLFRLWIWGGKQITPLKAGIVEIGNAVLFTVFTLWIM